MADFSAATSCAKLHPKMIISKIDLVMPMNVILRSQRRECLVFGKYHQTSCFSLSRFYVVRAPIFSFGKRSGLNESFSRSYCWGTLVDPENTTSTNLVSAIDQVLLMVSAIFAYMAGAVPQRRNPDFINDSRRKDIGSSPSTPYGRSEINENNPSLTTNDIWGEVSRKLLDALDATASGANLDESASDIEDDNTKYALSLFALNQGPIWRLLWAALWRLQKEVCYIQSSHDADNRVAWLMVVSEVFKGIITQICTKWLEEELSLGTGGCDMNLIVQITEKLKGNDVILNNIKRSGKTELYADLLYFLKFGPLRSCCSFGMNFLVNHGVEILEDLVITLADAVACIFLELLSVDSAISMEINSLGLKICPLSTRALQRLRNEVVLKQWLHHNFESVVSLYEDRFDLFVLSTKKIEDQLESQTKRSIWQNLIFRKQAILSTVNCIRITSISLTAKQTKELQALTGWRYYYSLFLEFSDIAMPFVKAVFDKARNAVSFFLMCMIGGSLGLIFSGIRQSLGWK